MKENINDNQRISSIIRIQIMKFTPKIPLMFKLQGINSKLIFDILFLFISGKPSIQKLCPHGFFWSWRSNLWFKWRSRKPANRQGLYLFSKEMLVRKCEKSLDGDPIKYPQKPALVSYRGRSRCIAENISNTCGRWVSNITLFHICSSLCIETFRHINSKMIIIFLENDFN